MPDTKTTVNLRTVAEKVGLAPCSVSAVLNDTPAAKAIPQATKERIFRAAAELNYRPNVWARSLRTKRTCMVAAVAPDFGRGDVARVLAGMQNRLHEKGYLLALGSVELNDANRTTAQLAQRGIEGVIAIDAAVPRQVQLPVASVHLGAMSSLESLSDEARAWLSEIGESAAETIVAQIENRNPSRRMTVDSKLSTYFALPVAWGTNAQASERA